jgi:hypothetical protein
MAVGAGLSPFPASAQADGNPVTLGTYRTLHSEILDEERTLQVFLPRGYEESELDYPVVYLFYSDLVEVYYARAVSVLSVLSLDLMPRAILVGVANTDRYRDLLPTASADGWGGGADRFLRFVREELFPFVDTEYRTKDYRIMIGPQAAAVFGVYALLEDPDLFQAFILNDPCRPDGEGRSLCDDLAEFASTPAAEGVFLSVAHGRNDPRLAESRLASLPSQLSRRARDGFRWRIAVDPSWELFLPPVQLQDGLLELFQGYRFPPDREVRGLPDVLSHYEALSRSYGFTVDAPDQILTMAAEGLSRSGDRQAALEVLNHLMALHPSSMNGLWQLANLHREMGDTATAVSYYRRCLDRDPNIAPAREWLRRLGGGG